MKLLITGAQGQLGNELIKILRSGRAEVGPISEAFTDVEIMAIDKDNLDLTDFQALEQVLLQFQPDIIINCAAITDVDGCEVNQNAAFKVNGELPHQLAVYAEAAGCKLVHISTDYVFEGASSIPYRESDACAPISIYGKSKYLGERYVQHHCKQAFIVRTAWMYGYHGHNFVKTIINAARDGKKLKVVCDQRGNPTSANDVAYHILKLVLTEQFGIYHCTNHGTCSWYEFACEVLRLINSSNLPLSCTTEEFYADRTYRSAPRPKHSSLDNEALRNTIGDEMRNWKDAVKEYIKNGENQGIFTT